MSLWIDEGVLLATVRRSSHAELAWLREVVSIPNNAARFAKRTMPARTTLLTDVSATFPAGLLGYVLARAAKDGVQVEVRDVRPPRAPVKPWGVVPWLEWFQWDALDAMLAAGRGVVQAPTASGKTEIMSAAAHRVAGPVLVLALKEELVVGFAERFKLRTGEVCGVVGGSKWTTARVTAASVKTLVHKLATKDKRAVELVRGAGMVLMDECQSAAATEASRVLKATTNAVWRFGFSATPFSRADGRNALVAAWLGGTIYRIDAAPLFESGAVARPRVVLHRFRHTPITAPSVWADARRLLISQNHVRTLALANVAMRAAKPAIVFVREVEHGRTLLAMLQRAGLRAEFVNGQDMKPAERLAVAARLDAGGLDVVVSSAVFQEGVNIPNLRAVVHGASGASHITTLQNAGRGMRARDLSGATVKATFEVHDLFDASCGCRKRDPDGKVRWDHRVCRWMDEHSGSRAQAYVRAGYEVRESSE